MNCSLLFPISSVSYIMTPSTCFSFQDLALYRYLLQWEGSKSQQFSTQITTPLFHIPIPFERTLSINPRTIKMASSVLFLAAFAGLHLEVRSSQFSFWLTFSFFFLFFSEFFFGGCFLTWFWDVQIKLMVGRELKQKKRYILGYMPWLRLRRIWLLSMFGPLKGVCAFISFFFFNTKCLVC